MSIHPTVPIAEEIQDPMNPAPDQVLESLRLLDIKHYGFDGAVRDGQIIMHKDSIDDVQAFFALAFELQFPIEKVIPISNSVYEWDDERSCADNNTSGFNYRPISGKPGTISNHGQGLAFDVNPVQNIYVRYDEKLQEIFRFPKDATYDPSSAGTLTASHPLVILLKKRGWNWGGDWTPASGRVDWQHFEKPTAVLA